jgi:type VI secretion system protein ImpK
MSDRPFDPFGRSDRTIIRPNPGGRRPAAPAPSEPPPIEDWAVPRPQPPPIGPGAPGGPPQQAPPPTGGPLPMADPAMLRRRDLDAPHHNPMMRAAHPLLLLLGRLRANLAQAQSAIIMDDVADAIQTFEHEIRSAGFSSDQIRVAKYAVCATADDIVQNIPVHDRSLWTQYSMLSRFFGERVGGVRFFEELERALKDPGVNYPILELMHACLALGFEGIHRTASGGVATLRQIQRRVYDTLRRVRVRGSEDLSPHWRGQTIVAHPGRNRVPFWAVASIVAVLLFALWIVLRTLLGNGSEAVAAALLRLNPNTPVTIERAIVVPPPPPPPEPVAPPDAITQLQRIRTALADEIAARLLDANQTANEIVITVGNVSLFRSGAAEVKPAFLPIAAKIAATLDKEPGWIKVTGHSDNQPIKTVRFPSNYELSLERARAVADIMRPRLAQPARLQVEGKGDTTPIASNETPEGRERNRRVEIMIPRAD